jgi:hypothetical protein
VEPTQERHSGLRDPVTIASGICLLLVVVASGAIGWLDRAWAFDLWHYLPVPVSVAFGIATASLALPPVRSLLVRGFTAASNRGGEAPLWILAPALALLFWLLRENHLYGDSKILLFTAAKWWFLFPDIGSTFLFHLGGVVGPLAGVGAVAATQAFVCVAGALAVVCFIQVGRLLAPERSGGALVAALILCGGVSRVFFGHVEVYAFVLLCAALYLWAGCAFLQGRTVSRRTGWVAPSLALGLGLWMHLSFIFLVPSHLALLWLANDGRPRAVEVLRSFAVMGVPVLLFLGAMLALGRWEELGLAWETLVEMAGLSEKADPHESWVRGPFAEPGAGTLYTLFSWPHLKYLVNAGFLLAPAAAPIVVAFALLRPAVLIARKETAFLSATTGMLLVYTAVVRPVWGPYDWDVFALPAVCGAALAAHLVVHELSGDRRAHFCALVIAASILLVSVPFVAIGIAPSRPAGLFAQERIERAPGESEWEAFERKIGPWL